MPYITKTNLTLGPQLGAQMLQYAGLYAVSKRLGLDMVFLKEFIHLERGIKLFDAFNLNERILSASDNISFMGFELKEMECDNDVFSVNPQHNWNITGWFHTYHYFDRFREDIRKQFRFKDTIVDKAKTNIDRVKNGESDPIVSIHFRRGDYLTLASLNLSFDYYNAALQKICEYAPHPKLLVFSDDMEWCKSNIAGDNVYYSENNSNYVDMCMMNMCDHHIIANSTFSWWGAYLNDKINKVVICPENYVNSDIESFINKNYYPKDWISIKEK